VSSTSIPRQRRPGWRVFFTEFYWTDERGLPQVRRPVGTLTPGDAARGPGGGVREARARMGAATRRVR
jgi:hypothetical protein